MNCKHHRNSVRRYAEMFKPLVVVLLAVCFVFPFLIMLMTSLKTTAEAMEPRFALLPEVFQWKNYPAVFGAINFVRMYLNTVIVAVSITFGQIWICSMAAFAFARLRFPHKNLLFFLVLAILMIPSQVTLIPNYLLINYFGWINTYFALIVPNLFSAFGTFFLRQQYMVIPHSLDEAAKMDGANPLQIFIRICLPQTINGMLAYGILAMIFGWNMYLWALIMSSDQSMYTLAVGLAFFRGQFSVNIPLMLAASAMSIVPIILLYCCSQKYYMEAISSSGIK